MIGIFLSGFAEQIALDIHPIRLVPYKRKGACNLESTSLFQDSKPFLSLFNIQT